MATGQTRPEPMNASPHHSKVKVSMTLASPLFVAGTHISGKMEMECRADKDLGISVMMVELFATQELTSRDHSATSMFLHSRRVFQGPGLPPSNAVQAHPLPGNLPLPQNYHQARRGVSTFLFRIPIPSSAPSSISFGSDLAKVRYEVRASVGVFWKGEKRLVTNKRDIEVVESYEHDFSRVEPEAVVVGEYGKIWAQGKVVGGIAVVGESACVELQVKNHSNKKNTGLVLTLTRTLILPGAKPSEKSPLQLSDVLTTVPFRGPEYIIPPGAEGVASLVFDVPNHARGVRGGTLEGDESEARMTESLFEVRCVIGIKMTMGLGSKDINLDLPVTIVHPAALPEGPPDQYVPPAPYPYAPPQVPYNQSPYAYPALPMSPPIPAFVDQGHVWLPPPMTMTPQPHQYYSPPIEGQQYYFPPAIPIYLPSRPLSAGPPGEALVHHHAAGMSPPVSQHLLLPLDMATSHPVEPEEGKGERASRVTHHLRLSSRHRSVSPQSHRFPLPSSNPLPIPPSNKPTLHLRNLPPPPPINTDNLAVSQDAVVHSPRPFLSPKHSYTEDPITHNSLPKSERVEELERMADEVMATTTDLSADIPKYAPQPVVDKHSDELSNINKTLPLPPVSTRKETRLSPLPERTRVDTYFISAPTPEPVPEPAPAQPIPSEKTPPTPTLTAVTPAKHYLGGGLRAESGLDALERRLLAEVGTRKIDAGERRPDVRSIVHPITIPTTKEPHEPLNDSAISSLTLAGEHEHDSDEKTHKAGKSSVSGDEQAEERRRRRREKGKDGKEKDKDGKDGERKSGRKREKDRGNGEGHKTRKSAAKGRVAAWLGEIDPQVPPLDELAPVSPAAIKKPPHPFAEDHTSAFEVEGVLQILPHAITAEAGKGKDAEKSAKHDARRKVDEDTHKDTTSAPNPRSSGFVPIGTLKRDTFQQRPAIKEMSVAEEARRAADIWSASPIVKDKSPIVPLIATPAHAPQSIRTDRRVSPPSSADPNKSDLSKNIWQNVKPGPVAEPASPLPKKVVQPSPRLPVFPPPRIDSEVKYDIQSARGGRGGKVTAVASIWASGTLTTEPKPREIAKKTPDLALTPEPTRAPLKSFLPSGSSASAEPKLVELAGKRARPVVKSSSVPAMISSSHATPTLSSTASLARPSPHRVKPSVKVPTTITETHSEGLSRPHAAKMIPSKSATGEGDLAFGQARLRDLIKKYQGQST